MSRHSSKRLNQIGYQQPLLYKWSVWILVCLVLVLAIWVGVLLEDNGKPLQTNEVSDDSFDTSTMQIAALISCSCGSCGEKNLSVCECPTALSTKRFITERLKSGSLQYEVIELVRNSFGYFKG